MRVMISQPMAGKHDADVKAIREELIEKFKEMHIEVVDSFDTKDAPVGVYNPPVYYLGRTIMNWLHSVDAVYFVDGWRDARGCRIEHEICKEYGIKCLYSDFFEKDTLKECTIAPASNITINRTGGIIQSNEYPKITY